MSADSPRRGLHRGAQVVSPQPIVDRSIIDNVAGIINDIVPQAYTGSPNSDNKESITWARFEYADINDPALYPDHNEGSSTPPLLLVLGYTTGVQVWLIAATGEATEVLSWRQGVVRILRILPNPKTDDDHVDLFEPKRPMVAICDSAGPGPQFCNISFVSLKTGEQTKSIKFKNPVCDILANRRSIVATFSERIAVFDARTLEDVLTVTTCYSSPGINPNPVALGTRWLAYCEKKLLPNRRSSGGCESDGVQSYTATVLYAAKSLGKGLRGLGETVASSLTGTTVTPIAVNNIGGDIIQPGVVTILDLQAAKEEKELDDGNIETVIAHFTAHSDVIVAMTFDSTGALLMTADKRGHDFHVFRIQPHPGGPTLAAVHHLYILHRGDTTAKVQDMTFSSDARWAAISTIRGTTHVFPVTPYGGPIAVRTHLSPHVVNQHSRFHRSAGLTDDGTRSHSPVSHAESSSVYPYSNPRLPPYPHPTILHPMAQIRQSSSLNHSHSQTQQRPQQRQRLHSDDTGGLPLKICACFAPPRAWIYTQRETSNKTTKRAVDSLFIMACHGNLIQYDLEPKAAAGVPKEKVCDDTGIELDVEIKGQWPLIRSPSSPEIVPPLPLSNLLLNITNIPKNIQSFESVEDRWLSRVEIITHAGPCRRLWMGPQFVFKTYNTPSGVAVNLVEAETVEVGITSSSRLARSNPVNMPHAASRSLLPVVIDGSGSSYEQSPRFVEAYGDPLDGEPLRVGSGENQLREDLADAMLEISMAPHRVSGRRSVFERVGQPVTKVVNPLGTVITVSADEEDVSSSQEFDSAEEGLAPELPRSVCAEEGPASLGDLEPESQTLRNLTEICAEMRSASEPAIDSVPDENIRDVKEQKALCVEIVSLPGSRPTTCPIDFEREGAFQDVPTNLSLCAEQGEIPSSPMTLAKENAWSGSSAKHEDVELHERNLAKAKYVVNYDENSVVLMENNTAWDRRAESKLTQGSPPSRPLASRQMIETANAKYSSRKSRGSERASRKSTVNFPPPPPPPAVAAVAATTAGTTKETKRAPIEVKTRVDHYIVKEQEDSIIVDDMDQSRNLRSSCLTNKSFATEVASLESDQGESNNQFSKETSSEKSKETKTTESLFKLRPWKLPDSVQTDVEIAQANVSCEKLLSKEAKESFVELETLELFAKEANPEISNLAKDTQFATEALGEVFYFNNLYGDYQIIEDIPDSELISIGIIDNPENTEIPIPHRKTSKSTISDDDLEYIHSSEILENLGKISTTAEETTIERDMQSYSASNIMRKGGLSSDDDLEYIHYSDISKSEFETGASNKEISNSSATCSKSCQETAPEQGSKSNSRKKPEVAIISKPLKEFCENKSAEKEPTLKMEKIESKEKSMDREALSVSSTKKVKGKTFKSGQLSTSMQKRHQAGAFEIIDIDAMQQTEMESVVEVLPISECKVASPRHDAYGTRSKKLRKNRKPLESNVQDTSVEMAPSFRALKMKIAELQEAAEELHTEGKWIEPKVQPPAEVSWSAIVKKKTPSITESELRKELDLEPLIEVEEKTENEEANDLEVTTDKTAVISLRKQQKSSELKLKVSECLKNIYTEEKKPHCRNVDKNILVDLEVNTVDVMNKVLPSAKPRISGKSRKGNLAESMESRGSLQRGAKQTEEDAASSDSRVPGGNQSFPNTSFEDLSSSSFSSASRASLDARSSPTPSYVADNMMVFPGDSSGSI